MSFKTECHDTYMCLSNPFFQGEWSGKNSLGPPCSGKILNLRVMTRPAVDTVWKEECIKVKRVTTNILLKLFQKCGCLLFHYGETCLAWNKKNKLVGLLIWCKYKNDYYLVICAQPVTVWMTCSTLLDKEKKIQLVQFSTWFNSCSHSPRLAGCTEKSQTFLIGWIGL